MRVVFLSAARQVWGAEVSLLTLAEALAEQGVESALICPDGELADRARQARIGDVQRVQPHSAALTRGRPRECARLWARYLSVAQPDDVLVIFSYYLLALAPVVRPLLRRKGVRIALDLHDDLCSRKARLAVRAGSAAVDTVIACSDFTARQLRGHADVSYLHRPVAAPPPGTAATHAPGEPLRVGIIGRITREKRHAMVIDAMRRVRSKAVLIVRGDGDGFSGDLARYVFEMGQRALGGRWLPQGRVSPVAALSDLDVLVVGNPREPLGRTVLEAQAQGVVVVVPDAGGASELVQDHVTGLVYGHDDPQDLARVIDEVAADEAMAARMAAAARLRVPRPGPYAAEYLRRLTAPQAS